MRRLLLFIALLLCWTAPASAGQWEYKLGPELPGLFYSVGSYVPGLGVVPTGQYGGGTVAGIDPATAGWRTLARLPVGPGHESVSVFQLIGGGAGLNAWTETDGGAQCWTAWAAEGWRWKLTQSFNPWPWALAGPSAASRGWVALGEGRKNRVAGGWLAAWGRNRWGPITPTIPGLFIWDAAPWGDGILLGCSVGNGQYLDEWAGRLVLVQGQDWRLVNIPAMAGVVRLASLESWPGRLWISTVWGEVWWTDDLEHWALWHREDYGKQHDAPVYELGGQLVVVGAGGKVWTYDSPDAAPELVAEIPGTEFMALSPVKLPGDGWCLAGPLTMFKSKKSQPVIIQPE